MNKLLKITGWFFLVIIVIIILYILIYSTSKTYIDFKERPPKEDIEKCEATGGKMNKDGLAQKYICVRTFSDAGKSCNSSIECMGQCIILGHVSIGSSGRTINYTGEGQCRGSDSPFGCSTRIESAREGKIEPCVD